MNKSISKWFSMLLLMMVAGMTGATAQSLIIDDFSIKAGETKDVPINLTVGENTVYGIQTDIVLSEGLTLEEVVAGEIAGENLSIASNVVGSGATRISQLSYTGETITAGNVITLKVTAAEDFTGGTIQLTNTRLTINTTGSEVTVNDLIVTVTKDEPVVINSMQLYGTFPGLSWEVGVEMTNTDSEPAIWSKTFEGVVLEGTTYEYKVSANGTWGEYQIPADNTNQTWTFGTDMYPAGTYNLTFTVDTENHTLSLTADKQAEPVKNELITLPCKENYTEGKFLLIEATEEISCNVWLEKVDAQTGARRFFKVAAGSTIMEDGVAMIELPDGYTEGEFTICADKEFTLKSVQLMATEDAAQPEEVIYTIEPEPEATYTVVGEPAAIFGSTWAPELEANDMTLVDGIWTKTYSNVPLQNGTVIKYKVVKNHAYANGEWGFDGNDATFTVWEGDGIYNVTFTFNPDAAVDDQGHNVGCKLEKQEVPVDIDALKTALQDAINLATALNAKLGDADLTTAIETATAALNSDDATVVIAAGEALKTAATTAASSALSYAVTLAKSLGVDTSDAEAALASGDAEQMAAALQNLMTAAKTPATNAVQTLISLLQQFNQEALSSIMPEMLAVKSAIDNNKPFAELKAAIEALVEKAKPYAPGIVEKIVGYAQEINNETLNQDIASIQAAGDDFFALLVAAQQLQNDFITVAGEYLAEVKAIPTEGKQGVEDLNTAIGALESALNATTPDLATVAVAVKNLVQAVKAFEEANTDKNYYILGDFWGWEEAPQLMTQSTENENVYTLVSVMTVEAKTYEYKLRQGDNWDGYQLPASGNYNFQFGTEEYPAGEYYTLTFTANVAEHTLDLVVEKVQPVVDPFNYEKIAIDPADHSTVESLQNFTLTFDGQLVTVNSEVKPTLGDALGEIALNGDGSVSVTFASAQTNPGDYTLEIPAGAILYYGTAIDPLSFKYTIAGGADFTIDPAEGVVESLSTFTVNFSYYIEAPEATAYLFNEETEQEITANVYEGAGKSLTVMLSEEVTTPGDWQLNIEGVKKMDGTPVELIFSYTIQSSEPDQNYYILGDFWGWDNPKQMEENEGLYTLVLDATVEANKEYKYKLRQGDNWDGYQLPAEGDYITSFEEAGDYTLTFTANVTGEEIGGIAAYTVILEAVKKGEPVEPLTPAFADGTYYLMNASTGKLAAANGLDKLGTPITFTFDENTGYTVAGSDLFAGRQWVAENDGYYTFYTVIDGVKKYASVKTDEFGMTASFELIDDGTADGAIWILLNQEYWENEALSYNVAGTADLCGAEWDTNANKMTKNAEGLYEWTAKNITVTNEVKPEFKIVVNNVADVEAIETVAWYPAGDNWVINPDVTKGEGVFDITITFNVATKEIGVAAEKVEEPIVVAHTWDFTKWSEATVANLKVEAAKVTVEDDPDNAGKTKCTDNGALWSDHEKTAKCDTYAASKDNCFWYVGGEVNPKANEVEIAEFEGLEFNESYGKARSLAIAVNYPVTSLGEYKGGAYLWLGGKGKDCFTIKNVKPGTIITMGVESHKPAEGRGVQLLVDGTSIGEFTPTTYDEHSWQVPEGENLVDVVVKNTNGCHIYFIDAEIGEETPEAVYTVVGDLALTGADWDVNATANDMVLDEETGKYEWTNSSIDIVSNTELGFKVVKNRSYEEGQWPYDNNWIIKLGATDELAEGGNYKITIVFNPEGTGSVSVIAERLGDATGINVINADIANGTAVYNMNGQKVQKTQKGLYIVNGRKVVIK